MATLRSISMGRRPGLLPKSLLFLLAASTAANAQFTPAPGSPFAVGTQPLSVAVGDFNGDGKPDLALANSVDNNVTVLLGNGSGGFTTPGATFAVGLDPWSVAVGDFNGDGKPDLAVANAGSNDVTVLLGNGSGGFTVASGSPFAVGYYPLSVAVGDFNGDGKPDLAVVNRVSDNVTVLLGDGSGGFTAVSSGALFPGFYPLSVAVGDFNGDGKPDLAVAQFEGDTVTVLLGNGSGGFTLASGSTFAGANFTSVAVGDFNGDGKPDLAVANWDDYVTVLLGNGSGGFTAASGSPFAAGSRSSSVAVGDFNGDGKPDLAVANRGSDNVTVLLGDGSGGFTAASGSPFAAGSGSFSVAVGDFNGDGRPDLAVADLDSNSVTVLLNTAPGTVPITFVTSPAGLPVTVDGGAPQVAPFALGLLPGFQHTIAVTQTQAGGPGTQYVFSSWSDGGAATHTITVAGTPATYTASFNVQYQLTTASSPAAGGAVSPLSGAFYYAGAVIGVQAFASSGYQFANFSGGLSRSTNPQIITLNGPANIVANFTKQAPSLAASVGARNGDAAGRQVTLTLTNTGVAAATNVKITDITGIQVLTGSGLVSKVSTFPMNVSPSIGTALSANATVIFNWPETAWRVRFTVNFTADGGYSGSSAITTFR